MKRLIENVNNVFNKAADHAENERSKRQITISIITLVMAIVLMGSVSWAWFTITNSVDIQEISVAMSEFKNLEIARAYNEDSRPAEVSTTDAETGDYTWGGVVDMSGHSIRLDGPAAYSHGLVATVQYDNNGRTSGLVTLSKEPMDYGLIEYTHTHSNIGLTQKVYAEGFGVWLRTNEENIGNILMTVGDVKAVEGSLNLPIGIAVRIDKSKTVIPATFNSRTGRYSTVIFKDADTYQLTPNEAHLVEIIVFYDGNKIFARDVDRRTHVSIGYISFNKAENWATETSVTISGTCDAPAVDDMYFAHNEVDGSLDLCVEANSAVDVNSYMYTATLKNLKGTSNDLDLTTTKIKPSASESGRIDLLGSAYSVHFDDNPFVKATGGLTSNSGTVTLSQNISVTTNEINDSGVSSLSIAKGLSSTTDMLTLTANSNSYDSTPSVKYDFVDPLDPDKLQYSLSGVHPGRYDLYFYNASDNSKFFRVSGTADPNGQDSLTLDFNLYKDTVSSTNFKCRVVSYDVEVSDGRGDSAHVSIYKTGLFNASKGISDESSGTCGYGVTWEYESGTLTISGSGKMYDYSYGNYAPWWSKYGESITSIVIESGVRYISGFQGLENLNSVYIEDGSIEIGQRCFAKCGSFELNYKCDDTIDKYAFYNAYAHITCRSHEGDSISRTARMRGGSTQVFYPYHTHHCTYTMEDTYDSIPLTCGICAEQAQATIYVEEWLD